jgi:non-ribosomal peptide synthetase component E (peptide arylation enzyme)
VPLTLLVRSGATPPGTSSVEDWLASAERPSVDASVEGGGGQSPLEIAVTSGSAGEPKSVLHVHDTALAAVDSTIRRQRILPEDVVHVAASVCHTFGYFYGVRCALQAGAAMVLQERWGPQRMVELIDRHAVTISLGPSAFVLELLRGATTYRRALARLRVFTHGGDTLPAPTMRRAIEELPFRISRAFGMTEFGHVSATDETTPRERCIDSVGSPQPEIDIRISDDHGAPLAPGTEGRILVRGPFLFAGYLTSDGVDDVLDAEGFFDTGDLGFLGVDGFLRITGRARHVIRRGAETVPAALLENLIADHPAVQHAVVVGVPDTRLGLGELPIACVQLRPGADLTLLEIEALLERHGVTRRFWPVRLRTVDEWPLGPTGKIDRRSLLARIADARP